MDIIFTRRIMMSENSKRKIVLFPANYESNVIYEHSKELKKYEISFIVTYKENEIEVQKNSIYTNDSEKALMDCDVLILCDNVQKMGKKAYINRINEAIRKNIPIYTSSFIYKWLGVEVFKDAETTILNSYNNRICTSSKKLRKVTCPVISILGDGENCDKFSLILSVKKVLEDKGYSVLVISGNPLARLFNCDVLPDFLYADDISLPLKVKRANSFICDLAEQKLPDIILISCPSGIMTLNDYEHNYFGEISYVLSNAIISDYGVLCIHYSKYYTDKYFDEMKKLCKLRLGVDIIKFY